MSEELHQAPDQEIAGFGIDLDTLKEIARVLGSPEVRQVLEQITKMVEVGSPANRYQWVVLACLFFIIAVQLATIALLLGSG